MARKLAIAKASVQNGLPIVSEPNSVRAPSGEAASLDDVDLSILEQLVGDARASQRRIAREVGMSPPAVAERIARLERTGVIRGYRAEIDRSLLGFSLVAYVSVVAENALKVPEDVLGALAALPEVEEATIVAGSMDLILRVRVRDHEHLRRCLFEHIGQLPGVKRTETFLWLRSTKPKPIDLDLIRTLRG